MSTPTAGADRPVDEDQGAPTDTPIAAGNQPGQPHPTPRPYSPLGGPLGPLISPDTVADAVEQTFILRIGAYVAAVAVDRPHITNPPLAMFVDWLDRPDISTLNPGQAPRYTITAPGLLGVPHRKGDGTYVATYAVRIQLWLWGKTWRDVRDRLGAYVVAVRTCLLQNPGLGGVARGLTWRTETVNPQLQSGGNHTWGTATVELGVTVDPAVNAAAGPAPLDPTKAASLPPPVTAVGVTLTDVPITTPGPPTR